MANDRHGRRGTIARVLMRLSLSSDILEERNSSWPEPPGGFSPKHVLGPDSDYPKRKNKNKRKRGRGSADSGGDSNDGNYQSNNEKNRNKKHGSDKRKRGSDGGGDANPESKLSRGLSSGRAGFSVEEMEAERARKKAKAESTDDGA